MKIRVFPSHDDKYNSIVIDIDALPVEENWLRSDPLPSVYISDLITDLISEN